MAKWDNERKKIINNQDEEDREGSDKGGQGGAIEFRDFLPTGTTTLSAIEEKEKLSEHKEKNSGFIEKQKKNRDDRKQLKEGKTAAYQYGYSMQTEIKSSYKNHPILSQASEFHNTDRQMNMNPNLNEAETNSEKKEELTYQYQKRFELLNQNKFIPPKPMMGA